MNPDTAPFDRAIRENGVSFSEPWQAQAFALTVALHKSGAFDWTDWSAALGAKIAARKAEGAEDYFLSWLEALETLIIDSGLAQSADIQALVADWREAYRTTPHGKPVLLARDR